MLSAEDLFCLSMYVVLLVLGNDRGEGEVDHFVLFFETNYQLTYRIHEKLHSWKCSI